MWISNLNFVCVHQANIKFKLCTYAQSHALGTHTKFQRDIPTVNVVFDIVFFRKIIL